MKSSDFWSMGCQTHWFDPQITPVRFEPLIGSFSLAWPHSFKQMHHERIGSMDLGSTHFQMNLAQKLVSNGPKPKVRAQNWIKSNRVSRRFDRRRQRTCLGMRQESHHPSPPSLKALVPPRAPNPYTSMLNYLCSSIFHYFSDIRSAHLAQVSPIIYTSTIKKILL